MPPNMPPSSYLAARLAQANGQLMPQGEPVAAFSRREEAFAAFDVLAAANYPITALYLVNEGLKQVEYPTQQGYGRPLLIALIQGILAGLFYSALVFFKPVLAISKFIYPKFLYTGPLLGLVGHSFGPFHTNSHYWEPAHVRLHSPTKNVFMIIV